VASHARSNDSFFTLISAFACFLFLTSSFTDEFNLGQLLKELGSSFVQIVEEESVTEQQVVKVLFL